LLSDGTFNYSYDSEGNLTRRTEIASGKVRDFSWDYRNRLTAVIDKTAANVETQKVAFTYDTYGRRISKAVDTSPLDTVDAAITHFVYDGQDVLLDFIDNDGSGPAALTLPQRYLHGPAVDQVLAQDDGVGNTLWHLSDHLGTVRDLVDSTGVVRNHLVYDSYGWLISQSNAAANSRYGYTGREHDHDLAQIYYRARHYDAAVGRFISEDPIGFGGGDANLASYVGNSPVLARDPSGMAREGLMSTYNCGGLALDTYEWIGTAQAVRNEITVQQKGKKLHSCEEKCKPCETKVWLYVRHDGKDPKKDGDFHVFSGKSDCKTGADPEVVMSKNGTEDIIVGPPEFFKMTEHQWGNFGDFHRANHGTDLPYPFGLITTFIERPGQVGRTEECYCIPAKSK
jgi:RHS repeat-associated protein